MALWSVLALAVGALGAFLLTHYVVDHHSEATPNPQTVTCRTWANLTSGQQDKILKALNAADGRSDTAANVEANCGIVASSPDDSVASVLS